VPTATTVSLYVEAGGHQFARYVNKFCMHFMAVHGSGFHRFESAGAYMQRYEIMSDILLLQLLKMLSVKCSPAVGAATDPSKRA
jgi:hypothetical protein